MCEGLPGHERSGGMRVWGTLRGCLALRSVGGKESVPGYDGCRRI